MSQASGVNLIQTVCSTCLTDVLMLHCRPPVFKTRQCIDWRFFIFLTVNFVEKFCYAYFLKWGREATPIKATFVHLVVYSRAKCKNEWWRGQGRWAVIIVAEASIHVYTDHIHLHVRSPSIFLPFSSWENGSNKHPTHQINGPQLNLRDLLTFVLVRPILSVWVP